MPNKWLLKMCAIHDIDLCRLRSQREKAIIAYLTDPAFLKNTEQNFTITGRLRLLLFPST